MPELTISPQTLTTHTKTAVTIQGGAFDEKTTAKLVRPGETVAVTGFKVGDGGALSAQVPCNEVGIYQVYIKDEGSGLKLRLKLLPENVRVRRLVRSEENGSVVLTGNVRFQQAGIYNLVVKNGGEEMVLPSAVTVTDNKA